MIAASSHHLMYSVNVCIPRHGKTSPIQVLYLGILDQSKMAANDPEYPRLHRILPVLPLFFEKPRYGRPLSN